MPVVEDQNHGTLPKMDDASQTQFARATDLSWNPDDEEHESGWYDEIQSTNLPTTRYFYDGQMVIEEDFTIENGFLPTITKTRYGLGARGVDFYATQVDSGTETVKFPIYDGHGNMIATLARNGSSYSLANERLYDVWGAVRSGSSTGAPSQRYCAHLGHKQDDESGLIYMRARYYEPSTGRFVSEEPAADGLNWYVYCNNRPIQALDADGRTSIHEYILYIAGIALAVMALTYFGVGFNYTRAADFLRHAANEYRDAIRFFSSAFPNQALAEDSEFLARMCEAAERGQRQAASNAFARGRLALGGLAALLMYMALLGAFQLDAELASLGSGFDILDTLFGS